MSCTLMRSAEFPWYSFFYEFDGFVGLQEDESTKTRVEEEYGDDFYRDVYDLSVSTVSWPKCYCMRWLHE